MYYDDPIFAKSFSRYERKRFGCCAVSLCLILALAISSTFKPHLRSLVDPVNFQFSINAAQDYMLVIDDYTSARQMSHASYCVSNTVERGNESGFSIFVVGGGDAQDLQLSISGDENTVRRNHTSAIFRPIAIKREKMEPKCTNSNYCEIEGDIRIEANSSTIFVLKKPLQTISNNSINSWSIEPYPRKGTSRVKKWTIKLSSGHNNIPKCTQNHTHSSILFSLGGFTGNYFHDFADLLFPLYSTSYRFRKQVTFLATDYKSWWTSKFKQILDKLTINQIVDIDKESTQVHCFNNIILGLKFHKELVLDSSLSNSPARVSMHNFRQLIRQAYSLERERTIVSSRKGDNNRKRRARLMILSRRKTRAILNEVEILRLARKLGYEVVLADAGVSTNMRSFARMVNSFDVLMGIHGAGLTNMVFLPDNAVVIQVVPFGPVDGFARLDFGNPADGMNLRYLEYKVALGESSLSKQYRNDHPILKDPNSYKEKGWNAIWSIYLDKQNVTIDLGRLKATLLEALNYLSRPP